MIFKFEKDIFKDNIFFESFQDKKIPLLKKHNNSCKFLKDGGCSRYKNRPFNCIMFPFDIKIVNGSFYWILWDFCCIPDGVEYQLTYFEKNFLSKLHENELRLYVDYTAQSDSFQDLNFKILRKTKMLN